MECRVGTVKERRIRNDEQTVLSGTLGDYFVCIRVSSPTLLTLSSLSLRQSFQLLKGFFILLIATSLLPTYSGLVVGCCIGLSMVPLGSGLFQSARDTVPKDPSPAALIIVKSRGPSLIRLAAVVGTVSVEGTCERGGRLPPGPWLLLPRRPSCCCAMEPRREEEESSDGLQPGL